MATKSNLFKDKESYSEELAEAKAVKSGKITPDQYARGEQKESKMAIGGRTPMPAPRGLANVSAKPAPVQPTPVQPTPVAAYAKGGNVGINRGMENPMPKPKAMGTLGRAFSKGGYTSAADGVAQRGKTRAQQFKAGGKCK
jgi:hypothetical protein